MRTMATAIFLLLALALAAPAAAQAPPAGADVFSFYGLRFGMTKDEVRAVVKTNAEATEVTQVGHGMVFLNLAYDFRGRLNEIRASYERPAGRLQETGLRQALRERFLQPIPQRWRTVIVDLDEQGNRAALTLVLVSGDLRQEEIEHYKKGYLDAMD